MYVTARITHGRRLISRARRTRIAIVRGAKYSNGPLVDREGKPVANTFSFIAGGKLRMLAAMSSAIERTRCKGRRNPASRRIKPGYVLGTLTVGLRPDAATGLGGDAEFGVLAENDDTGDGIAVQPSGGARPGERRGDFTAPLAAGASVSLACSAGQDCTPTGGSYGIAGGFDLVSGDRHTTVGNLTVSITSDSRTVQGTIDGAPVTITETSVDFTRDFDQLAAAALGVPIRGAFDVRALFTRTGPAP